MLLPAHLPVTFYERLRSILLVHFCACRSRATYYQSNGQGRYPMGPDGQCLSNGLIEWLPLGAA